MSDWSSQPAPRPDPLLPGDLVSYRKENIIVLSSTCGVGLVTGLIGALILALTPDVTNATDSLIAGIVLVVIAALAFAGGITFCICKGGDVCDLCAG